MDKRSRVRTRTADSTVGSKDADAPRRIRKLDPRKLALCPRRPQLPHVLEARWLNLMRKLVLT
jgi:hypothetical protein